MRVVITGATGNVGTALLRALAADEEVESVVGLARRGVEWRPAKVEWRRLDVATADLREHFEGADAVVHLAWAIQPSRDLAALEATNVIGSENVFRSAFAAGVPALIHASSVGVYSPGPQDRPVTEDWPRDGIKQSFYSRHKAAAERILDRLGPGAEGTRVVRLRPGLIFQRDAATEIRRYFMGPFMPNALVRPGLIPLVPTIRGLRFQAVHADDVAEAYRLAIHSEAEGAFNIAADPVLSIDDVASMMRARQLPVPPALLRGLAELSWRLHLQPTPRGWVEMGLRVPAMDTRRAREELGWHALRPADESLRELLDAVREGRDGPTPPLAHASGGPARIGEIRSGVGAHT